MNYKSKSNNYENKKKKERHYIEEFQKVYVNFPIGIIDCSGEEPDCLIENENKIIGIEIENYFSNSNKPNKNKFTPKQIEEFQNRIINIAKLEFSKKSSILDVKFYWRENVEEVKEKDVARIVNNIVEAIYLYCPHDPYGITEIDPEKLNEFGLNGLFLNISIRRMDSCFTANFWSYSQSGYS